MRDLRSYGALFPRVFLGVPNMKKNTLLHVIPTMTIKYILLLANLTTYPLVNIQKAMENGPVEIVDFPMKNCDFPLLFVGSPEGNNFLTWQVGKRPAPSGSFCCCPTLPTLRWCHSLHRESAVFYLTS